MRISRIPALCMLGLIVLYQRMISPFLPKRCRFLPTCSDYGLEAIQVHGFVKGGWLLTRRLCRCHPWGGSGVDPVPILLQPQHEDNKES